MLKRLFFVIILIYGALDVTSQAALVGAKPQRRPKDEAVFIFQNNFWVNLHHFVRGESRRRMLNIPLELPLSELSQNERTSWEGALDTYVEFAKRNLIFDESLIQIDNILAQVTDTEVLRATGIQPNILAALNSAAEVYRAHRWQEHSRENELWIAAHGPPIRLHEVAIRKAIARALRTASSNASILVDVVRDIGPNLAYTTAGPKGTSGHTVIAPQSNSDPDVALDTIFHEISHTMDNDISRMINEEAKRQKVNIPSDLWHAITLYTTGEIVKRELRRQADPAYRPDVDRIAMFKRNGWERILIDLEKYWKPYLNRQISVRRALRGVIRDLAVEASHQSYVATIAGSEYRSSLFMRD
jgi:hypothetical protein